MLRALVDARRIVALAVTGAVGVWGLSAYPFVADNAFLGLIDVRAPRVFALLRYGYATLWFTTPFLAASLLVSLVAIAMYRRVPSAQFQALPPYPDPESRPMPTLVLGEAHFEAAPGRAPAPQWLTIPQRGLYTGIMVLGARGHRQDVGVHVPLRRPVAALAQCRTRPEDRRPRPGSEGRLLWPGARHATAHRTGVRLRRDRARLWHLLQPAAQRPRPVRRGLRHRHVAEPSRDSSDARRARVREFVSSYRTLRDDHGQAVRLSTLALSDPRIAADTLCRSSPGKPSRSSRWRVSRRAIGCWPGTCCRAARGRPPASRCPTSSSRRVSRPVRPPCSWRTTIRAGIPPRVRRCPTHPTARPGS